VKTTNLPWVIEDASLARELNINLQSVRLINDLEAIARAVPILRPSDVHTINAGGTGSQRSDRRHCSRQPV